MNKRGASEVCFGLALRGILSPDALNRENLANPYNRALSKIGEYDMARLKAEFGADNIGRAVYSAEDIPGEEASEWPGLLDKLATYDSVGRNLEKIGKRLQDGENEASDTILQLAQQLDKGTSDIMTLYDVEDVDEFYVPSHYGPIDEHVGGLAIAGLTIVAGPAGNGKTMMLNRILAEHAALDKLSLFYSLELKAPLTKKRLVVSMPKLGKRKLKNILIYDQIISVRELYAHAIRVAAEYPQLTVIGIDYADKLVRGQQSEESMGEIYNTCTQLASTTGLPVVLIAGLSRNYVGGEPMANHIRYSGRAEHDASTILLTYNPHLLEVDMGQSNDRVHLKCPVGQAFIKIGKARLGTQHNGMLGAIRLKWDERGGRWGTQTIEWHPKIVG